MIYEPYIPVQFVYMRHVSVGYFVKKYKMGSMSISEQPYIITVSSDPLNESI